MTKTTGIRGANRGFPKQRLDKYPILGSKYALIGVLQEPFKCALGGAFQFLLSKLHHCYRREVNTPKSLTATQHISFIFPRKRASETPKPASREMPEIPGIKDPKSGAYLNASERDP